MLINPGLIRNLGGGGISRFMTFQSPLMSTVSIARGTGTATFTRASKQYVDDHSDLEYAVDDSAVFQTDLRAVTNFALQSDNISTSPWVSYAACTFTASTITFAATTDSGRAQNIMSYIDRFSGKIVRVSFTASVDSGTKKVRTLNCGLFSPDITLTTESKRYSYAVADPSGTNRYMGIVNGTDASVGTINISNIQFEILTTSTNLVGEYIPTNTKPVTKFFNYANPFTVANNIVTDTGVRTPIGTQDGILIEPSLTNKCTCYGVPRADAISADLVDTINTAAAWTTYGTNTIVDDASEVKITYVDNVSGGYTQLRATKGLTTDLTIGKTYKISGNARVSAGANVSLFISADGSSGVTVQNITSTVVVPFSVSFVAQSTNGAYLRATVMGAGESIWFSGITFVETTDLVTTQTKYFIDGFIQAIPNMTLSGDTSAVLSIVDDTAAVEAAGLGNVCNGGKVYKLDNSNVGATQVARVSFAMSTNNPAGAVYADTVYCRKASGSGSSILTTAQTAGITNITSSSYTRIQRIGAHNDATDTVSLRAGVGDILYFILPEQVEYPVATSVMPSLGTFGARAVQSLSVPTSGNVPAESAVTNSAKQSGDLTQAVWSLYGGATKTGNDVTFAAGATSNVYQQSIPATSGDTILVSAKLSGTGKARLCVMGLAGTFAYPSSDIQLTVTPTWYTFSATVTGAGTASGIAIMNGTTALVHTISVAAAQWELITATPAKTFTGYVPTTTTALTALPAIYVGNPGWTLKLTYKYLGGATATIPHTLWSTWTDANNNIALQYNGAIMFIAKKVAGVTTYVTFPLTAVIGTSYNVTMRLNQDYTMQLFVNGVGAGTGLGTELITTAADRDFSSDTGFWTKTTGATIGSNILTFASVLDTGGIYKLSGAITPVTGMPLQYSFDILTLTAGGVKAFAGNSASGSGVTKSTTGTYTHTVHLPNTIASSLTGAGLLAVGTTSGTFDNFSIKVITNSTDSTIPVYATTFHIGDFATGTPSLHANGMIKDVKIYGVALADSQC